MLSEVCDLPYRSRIRRTPDAQSGEIKKWLVNGWNTECLLRTNVRALSGDALRNSLQWAFPQAYYSVFTVCSAWFKTVGHTETAHAAVIRKFGAEAKLAHYPPALSFIAEGGKARTFENISGSELPGPFYLNPYDPGVIDAQIARFLNATRKLDLVARSKDMRFRRKDGTPKKRLTSAEWDDVSSSLGATSLMSLLYRKRIKSNYQEIDTFLSEELEPYLLYGDLITVVESLNLVHEAFVLAALGVHDYADLVGALPGDDHAFLRDRFDDLRRLRSDR